MLKRRNKKGFTLAELLIVVAIIAVLVAIAVPLFVNGLQKAETARDDANVRAVKSAAVVQILNTEVITTAGEEGSPKATASDTAGEGIIYKANGNLHSYYKVVANLDKKGNISGKLTITSMEKTAYDTAIADKSTKECAATNTGWTVTTYLTATDLNA